MPNEIPRSSSTCARICFATFRPVETSRLDHWLDELPYHKQLALSRKPCREDKTASLMGLQLLKLGMRGLGFSEFSLRDLNYRPNGKPTGADEVDFSISHGGGLIACLIGMGGRIGIDVEPLSASGVPSRLRRYLNPDELATARSAPLAGLRIWTAKEAIIKAAGDASLRDLAAVTVHRDHGVFRDRCWHLQQPYLAAGYLAQVATEKPQTPVTITHHRLS